MRIVFALGIIAILSGCASTSSQSPYNSSGATASSPELTPASVAPPEVDWQTFTDFSSLRDAFAHREDFSKRCVKNAPRELFTDQDDGKSFGRAAEIAGNFLNQCPVSARFHIVYAMALSGLGQTQKAKVHVRWFIGLTNSAMGKGDGKSPETAFATVSTMEGRAVLARLKLHPIQKVLIQVSVKTRVEAITAINRSGEIQTIYFDPRWEFIELAKAGQCQTNQPSKPLKSCDKYECIFVWSSSC